MEGTTFKPTHKLLLCCSAVPVFPGSDDEQRRWFNKIKTMRLKGRFIVGEADEGRKFSVEMCKRLTGGDPLPGRTLCEISKIGEENASV